MPMPVPRKKYILILLGSLTVLLACLAAVRLLFAGNVHESVQPVVSHALAICQVKACAKVCAGSAS